MTATFEKRSRIGAPAAVVFDWHLRPEALADLTPPREPVRLEDRTGGPELIGSRVTLRVGPGPFAIRWVAEHTHFEPGRMFRDVQVSGPFAVWEHTHRVEPDGPDACWLVDSVRYELPFGRVGALLGGWFARRKIQRLFEYRHRITTEACEAA